MRRLKANDSSLSALDLLFGRYSQLVFSIALRILGDRGEAEDLVQETFFSLFQRAAGFDPLKGSARAWIIQMAVHRALDRRSYLCRRRFYAGTELDFLEDTLAAEDDLDRDIGARLDRSQLEKGFAELPELHRRVIELVFFEGLTLREIAGMLQEPYGNVRHHYYHGLERLRRNSFVQALRKGKP